MITVLMKDQFRDAALRAGFACDLRAGDFEEEVVIVFGEDSNFGCAVGCANRWPPSRVMAMMNLGASS
ncbi:MAG TPA: hypothetical protein VHX14_02150 [Thermoanaerobaculia bacterium]|jgi:hypothetical protein|nr:hypothetical protein [Thermoanaerobaculia bacterium]